MQISMAHRKTSLSQRTPRTGWATPRTRHAPVACNGLALLNYKRFVGFNSDLRGPPLTRTAEYCGQHAMGTMVNLTNKRSIHEGCGKTLSFGVDGRKMTEYCAQHAPDEMVSVSSKRCRTQGSSIGVIGPKTVEYCAQRAPDGMVDVRSTECLTEGCSKQASFGVAGTKMAEYCPQHTPDGMVNVRSRKC